LKNKILSIFLILLLFGLGAAFLLYQASQNQPDPPVSGLQTSRPAAPSPASNSTDVSITPLPAATRPLIVGPSVSQLAPEFTLTTLEGKEVSLEDYRGKLVLLNFWASWCIPCKAEMPLIQEVYEKYQDRGLVVLGMNMTDLDQREDAEKFVEETGVTFPILLDDSGSVSEAYRVISVPTSFFIDPSGVVRNFQLGPMSADQLDEYMSKLLPK